MNLTRKNYNDLTFKIFKKYKENFLNTDFKIKTSQINKEFILTSPFMFSKDDHYKIKLLHDLSLGLSKTNKEDEMTCIGTGCIDDNNIMIVGMAPGFYNGTEFDKLSKPFKPSFYFSNTSRILRLGLFEILDKIYFTNLSKIVTTKEKMNSDIYKNYYNKHYNIFETELEIINPKIIICLGRIVYDFLYKKDLKQKVIYWYHPSYFIYQHSESHGIQYYKDKGEEFK